MKNKILKAALLHFQAEKAKAEANLEIYLRNAAGVAEHPGIVSEVIGLTQVLAEAEECVKILENYKEKK